MKILLNLKSVTGERYYVMLCKFNEIPNFFLFSFNFSFIYNNVYVIMCLKITSQNNHIVKNIINYFLVGKGMINTMNLCMCKSGNFESFFHIPFITVYLFEFLCYLIFFQEFYFKSLLTTPSS